MDTVQSSRSECGDRRHPAVTLHPAKTAKSSKPSGPRFLRLLPRHGAFSLYSRWCIKMVHSTTTMKNKIKMLKYFSNMGYISIGFA